MTNDSPVKHYPTYYVKTDHNEFWGDSHWVYAHYPTTEPDTPYMLFAIKENAEIVCEVLNAESVGKACLIRKEG